MEKEIDLKYIKSFSELSVRNVCLDLKINYPNIMSGQASKENIHKVRKEIERRLEILKENGR